MTIQEIMALPMAQQKAFLALYARPLDNGRVPYPAFVAATTRGWSKELIVPWAGMFIGIELDGYTHS